MQSAMIFSRLMSCVPRAKLPRSSQSNAWLSANRHQPRGIETILRLPEFQDDKAADQRLVERPRGKHAEIVDVPRLVALITGADFSGDDFGKREAVDICRRERQALKIALGALRQPFRAERRGLAAADLEFYFTLTAGIPVVDVGWISTL